MPPSTRVSAEYTHTLYFVLVQYVLISIHARDFSTVYVRGDILLFTDYPGTHELNTRLANTRHRYEYHFILAEYWGPGYRGTWVRGYPVQTSTRVPGYLSSLGNPREMATIIP